MLTRMLVAAAVATALVSCVEPEPKPAVVAPEPPIASSPPLDAAPARRAAAPLPAEIVPPAPPPPQTPLRDHLFFAAPSPDPRPLVVVLHGYGTSAAIVAKILDADAVARAHDVHLLLPNGTEDDNGRLAWNATDACCDFDGRDVDDVAAIADLLAAKTASHRIDADRLYVAGFSNGAFMAHRLACELSDRLAAVVAMSGVGFQDPARCEAKGPVGLLQIHGDADPIVAYDGGHVLGRTHLPRHPGSDDTVAQWAERAGCSGYREDRMLFSDHPTSRRIHLGCQASVERWKVEGGGHVLGTDRASVDRVLAFLLSQRRASAPEVP